jgi:hypothetical protein
MILPVITATAEPIPIFLLSRDEFMQQDVWVKNKVQVMEIRKGL